jgi:hypothetical protein
MMTATFYSFIVSALSAMAFLTAWTPIFLSIRVVNGRPDAINITNTDLFEPRPIRSTDVNQQKKRPFSTVIDHSAFQNPDRWIVPAMARPSFFRVSVDRVGNPGRIGKERRGDTNGLFEAIPTFNGRSRQLFQKPSIGVTIF